jgi:hypothetical protein
MYRSCPRNETLEFSMNSKQMSQLGLASDKPYYGMFSDAGNEAIDSLIAGAQKLDLDWPAVYFALTVLARNPKFGEATDTVVRERVYDALQFETPFYI